MKILSAKNNKFDATFEVELDAKQWKEQNKKTKNNLAKNIQIQGFRKGHVPQAEIDKRISDQDVAIRALESMKETIVRDIISSKEFNDSDCIDSVSKMEITKIEPTPVLKISFDLVPTVIDFNKDDVKKITVPAFDFKPVEDAAVKNEIKRMIRPDAMVATKKDGTVANGDIAVIDFKGFIDGKAFAGGEAKNFELEIGSKSFIDNFESQLIGCKKGDKKTVNVTFPKDYGMKDYAGKPAKFEVEVKGIKTITYPEITKEYCKKFLMDCNNMDELVKHFKETYKQGEELKYQDFAMKIIGETIAGKAKLNYYPASLLQMHKSQIMQQNEQFVKEKGFKSFADYKKSSKEFDNDKFEKTLDEVAKQTLTLSVVYEKLIEQYKIVVEKEDEKEYLSNLTRYFGGNEKTAKQMMEKNKEFIESNILKQKLFKKLVAEAKKESKKENKK